MSELILDKINNDFNINYKNGLYSFDNINNIPNLSQRIIKSLTEIKPNNIFTINGKVIILFFNKDKNKKDIFKKCWNFGEAPIIIIENESDFEVYNGFEFILENGLFELEPLDSKDLNYLSLMSGRYFTEDKFEQKDKRVDKVLLKNIKDAREILIIKLANGDLQNKLLKLSLERNKDKKKKIINTFTDEESKNLKPLQTIANSLIGRIIFIRYLIDREVTLNFESNKKQLTNDELKDILDSKDTTYKLFKYLKSDKGFNGDWFPISDKEEDLVTQEHLSILKNLISGTEIKTGQASLFDYYDFSIIPIEFISNIYESFIGDEQQKKDGAYYTPTFLVDYILKYTVDDYFKNNPNEYNCKILDPACGSGIFLVETLRKLVAQYEKVNEKPISANTLKKLVKDNIYAIDYNKDALSISVFSLYITMLDYQNPKEIEKFQFPNLLKSYKNLNPNFFEDDFFDIEAPYNEILKKKKLNFIIGNPPYGGSSIKNGSVASDYVKNNKLKIANGDIVQAFMIRVKDLVSKNTKISFIVTSKVLYNLQAKKFRTKEFFNQFKLNHILELSSVRKEIFENANVPVSILLYEYSTEEEVLKNVINYISMKPNPYFEKLKILLLTKSDFKKVNQSKLLDNDYLWKILVYGSYLDFNFIKRLKLEYKTINEISDIHNYKKGMGIQAHKGTHNINYHYDKEFIETPLGKESDKYMSSFYIADILPKWKITTKVYRKGEEKLFNKYSVLIRGGVNPQTLRAKSAILYKEAVFKHSLTGVNVDNKNQAKNFIGLINSNLITYYNLEIASSLAIEREILQNEEKLKIPFIRNSQIISNVTKIENLKKEYFDTNSSNILNYEQDLTTLIYELDEIVLKAFELNEQEYALVDYANSIMIPWIMQKNYDIAFGKYEYKDKKLEEYVNIFIKHYSNIYEQNDMYFKAEILWSEYAIGIYFKVLNEKPDEDIKWEKEKNIENFLKLSNGKTLENLFIQKDIKGFEPNGFYVVKPNEYKNWHKAIGYLDFYEFDKAILKAGR